MKRFTFLLILLSYLSGIFAQTDDRSIFEQYKSTINPKQSLDKLILQTGIFFLDKPYVGYTLEGNDPERLVVNLRELDCTTFVETTFALALTARSNDFTYENFCNNLTKIRYRDGNIDRYPSRLHYFSDWIINNTAKGLIKDITPKMSDDTVRFSIGFMSTHPDKYKALAAHPEFVSEIAARETLINNHTFHYIPKDKVAEKSSKIKPGDIIAITTNLRGLDISHVGFAIKRGKQLCFMHASSTGKKVIITETSLADYLKNVKIHTGILVIRPQ